VGDTSRVVYPRSAIKALQAIPLIESGAADRFGFGKPEIALACASHHGTERHTRLAAKMLRKAGREERDLGCGPHWPMGEAAGAEMTRRGGHPTRLDNNCSGKHTGMVATCVHTEAPVAGYTDPEHPVQVAIRQRLTAIVGFVYGPQTCGIDGCSAPNWASPIHNLAHAFALIGTRSGAAAPHAAALERILDACWAEPELVQGPGGLDSQVLARLSGRVYMKTGAEGVYCACVPALGLGIALKIDDGATRASQAVVMEILARLVPDAADLVPPAVIKDFNGRPAGERRMSAELASALDGMRV
jgi:L-asparaginase II